MFAKLFYTRPYCPSCGGNGFQEITRRCCGETSPYTRDCDCNGYVLDYLRRCPCAAEARTIKMTASRVDSVRGRKK